MRRLFLVFLTAMTCLSMMGQQKSTVVLEIDKQKFFLDEFEFVYHKNNQLSQSPLTPHEYLDLFTNYKLKVIEAERLGYDKREGFVKEFSYYRDELAKPYLTDKRAEDLVIEEAYERLKLEVDASHVLVRFPSQTPSPEDTLKAWQRIHELKAMIDQGKSFSDVASAHSEDPSARQNKGHLGYFSGFQMVYPFETAAYQTPVGQMSGVVRTAFGYHLILVHDKRPTRGEILVSHIMKMYPYNAEGAQEQKAKASIDSIYALIQQGADFEQLARELSDDRQSAENEGQMPWFSPGRMIPEFATPAFELKVNGDISQPIKTPYGWHIIKRIDHRGIESFENMRDEISKRIASDERAFAGQQAVLRRLKETLQFQSYPNAIEPLKSVLKTDSINDSIFYSRVMLMNDPVCVFAKQRLTQTDFAKYLQSKSWPVSAKNGADLDEQLEQFCHAQLLDYEKANLYNNRPDYRFLVSEYHDGLLIFEISQAEIWNKAAADTAGLEAFFNLRRASYPKPVSWEGSLYYCANDSVYDVVKNLIANKSRSEADSLVKAMALPVSQLKVESVKAIKGNKPLIDKEVFGVADAHVTYPKGYDRALLSGKSYPEGLYELSEIRGQVLSDYQVEVEKQWIASLKERYRPKVNYKALRKMKGTDAK